MFMIVLELSIRFCEANQLIMIACSDKGGRSEAAMDPQTLFMEEMSMGEELMAAGALLIYCILFRSTDNEIEEGRNRDSDQEFLKVTLIV